MPCCYDNRTCFYSDRIILSTKAAGVFHASVVTEQVAMVRAMLLTISAKVCHVSMVTDLSYQP